MAKSKKEKLLNEDQVIDFLENFNIYRPGSYDVDFQIIRGCLREFTEKRTMETLSDYEKIMFLIWDSKRDVHEGVYYEPEKLLAIENILNKDENGVLEYFSREEVIQIRPSFTKIREFSQSMDKKHG